MVKEIKVGDRIQYNDKVGQLCRVRKSGPMTYMSIRFHNYGTIIHVWVSNYEWIEETQLWKIK